MPRSRRPAPLLLVGLAIVLFMSARRSERKGVRRVEAICADYPALIEFLGDNNFGVVVNERACRYVKCMDVAKRPPTVIDDLGRIAAERARRHGKLNQDIYDVLKACVADVKKQLNR
jgi:hypothetical protein